MNHGLLRDVGLSIISASGAGFVAYKFKMPLLLGYLAAGIILGPHLGFSIISSSENISILSEIGLVLLMYILGMEIDLKKLIKSGKAVFVNGITQFLGCAIIAFFFFQLFGFKLAPGNFDLLYFAVAGSLSSTLIVVKVLSERMGIDTLTSRITLGVLVLQDIWAIAFLAAQPNLADFEPFILAMSICKAGILIFSSWLLAKYILPSIFEKAGKQVELLLVCAMAWCFSIAGLANFLGLSLEMGALVAGVSIASFPYHVQIAVKISSLRDFFITLFFVGLGMQIPNPSSEILLIAGGIVAFALFSRLITIYPVLYFLKFGNRGSLVPALNLSQISEFSLVLVTLGVSYGHLEKKILSAFIIALVTTTLISSIIIPYTHEIYRFLSPFLEKMKLTDHVDQETPADELASKNLGPSIVILGFYRSASSLLTEIETRHSKSALSEIKVVDFNPETIRRLHEKGIAAQYGDIGHSDTLHHLNLRNAKLVISTIADPFLKGTSNLKILKHLKEICPQAKIIVTAETIETAKDMYKAGAAYVFIPRIVSAHYLADILERIESGADENVRNNAIKFLETRKELIE